jgi:hypothetical protein
VPLRPHHSRVADGIVRRNLQVFDIGADHYWALIGRTRQNEATNATYANDPRDLLDQRLIPSSKTTLHSQVDGASKDKLFVLTPQPLLVTETTNGDRVELNAQSWAIGQHAGPVFNKDGLFEDWVAERVVADVMLDRRLLHDIFRLCG